ncbi:hypothetical protein BBJ28_00003621 [Nothophytophthora sp. Chile5]|nr:hypothetical protein BBJ28_00003621 [Nothophytophthora sp. Chile5]
MARLVATSRYKLDIKTTITRTRGVGHPAELQPRYDERKPVGSGKGFENEFRRVNGLETTFFFNDIDWRKLKRDEPVLNYIDDLLHMRRVLRENNGEMAESELARILICNMHDVYKAKVDEFICSRSTRGLLSIKEVLAAVRTRRSVTSATREAMAAVKTGTAVEAATEAEVKVCGKSTTYMVDDRVAPHYILTIYFNKSKGIALELWNTGYAVMDLSAGEDVTLALSEVNKPPINHFEHISGNIYAASDDPYHLQATVALETASSIRVVNRFMIALVSDLHPA